MKKLSFDFSFKGKMSRKGLFTALIVCFFINLFVYYFPAVSMPVFSWGPDLLKIYTVAFRLTVTLWALYARVGCFIKRLNDLGVSRLWVLLLPVPLLNGLFVIYLLFAPGKRSNES